MSRQDDRYWTEREAELFRHLPGTALPDPSIEGEVAAALRAEGILSARVEGRRVWRYALLAAAASFVIGVALGRGTAPREAGSVRSTPVVLPAASGSGSQGQLPGRATAAADTGEASVVRYVGM